MSSVPTYVPESVRQLDVVVTAVLQDGANECEHSCIFILLRQHSAGGRAPAHQCCNLCSRLPNRAARRVRVCGGCFQEGLYMLALSR